MENNVKIITIFDKHEDFIKLQYDSIIKFVKGDYSYIVFNNASTEEQANKNKKICDELGITCIRIQVNYHQGPSNIAGTALNIAFSHVQNELVFKIDSDMFFISDINLNTLFNESDLIFIPNYQPNREIMWSGVFGINLKKIDIKLDFNPSVISGTDTFGQSCLLTMDPKYRKKLFTLYNIQDIKDDVIITSLNNDCGVFFKNNEITFIEKPEFYNNKTIENLPIKYENIIYKLKEYNFPEPYNIDIIEIDGVDFIIHFKSSNWCPWYTDTYVLNKKESLKKYIENI